MSATCHCSRALPFVLCLLAASLAAPRLEADDTAAPADAGQRRHLRYKLAPGETLRWKVTHLVTIETVINGNSQTAKTHSESTKVWRIEPAASPDQVKIVHSVAEVLMRQQVADRPEVRYNSRTDQQPPREYEQVAATLGKPLATVTIDLGGRLVDRQNHLAQFSSPGMSEFALPLPAAPVAVGEAWSETEDVMLKLPGGQTKTVKLRQQFTLDKVAHGVATISIKTQPLTPVNDPQLESQLIQRLTKGTAKFDIDAGRLLSKQIDLDERVVGFSGAGSVMHYLARLTEELVDDANGPEPAARSADASADASPAPAQPAGPPERR